MFMEIIVLLVSCILTYFVTSFFFFKKKEVSIGYLRVDNSEPTEPPYLFLELEQAPDNLKDGDRVVLTVKIENYISQK